MLKKSLCALTLLMAVCFTASALDLKDLPNPLENAKEGQWVSYKMPQGMEQKQSISKIEGSGDDRKITIAFETLMGGQALHKEEKTFDYKEYQQSRFEDVSDDVKVTKGKTSANGKDYDVSILEFTTEDGQTVKLYMSEAVPVTALVKMELGAMGALLELSDFNK